MQQTLILWVYLAEHLTRYLPTVGFRMLLTQYQLEGSIFPIDSDIPVGFDDCLRLIDRFFNDETLNQQALPGAIEALARAFRSTPQRRDARIVAVGEELEAKFIEEATARDLIGLKGHRSVGGCRASLYNAMTVEGVQVLSEFMKEFADNNG